MLQDTSCRLHWEVIAARRISSRTEPCGSQGEWLNRLMQILAYLGVPNDEMKILVLLLADGKLHDESLQDFCSRSSLYSQLGRSLVDLNTSGLLGWPRFVD